MNLATIIVIVIILLWVSIAINYLYKNRGKCSNCSENCSLCGKNSKITRKRINEIKKQIELEFKK